ncbi:hydroxymethylbilane synthase [Corynebacterium kroppenstedtii]|uniref:hydroxymethylbilane synthase n=1 Tax=Corynebacterium sp. PCR 32 TaxID=3351342 RepID=UPI0030B6F296
MIRIGTRGSTLALTQAGHVRDTLIAAGVDAELYTVHTPGDASQRAGTPVARIGVGVFTQTLRTALAAGECALAVHSFKDLPTAPDPRFRVAVPPRVDARDVVFSRGRVPLAELPSGAMIGTGAPRRMAQVRALRPDCTVVPIRGNVDTRIGRLDDDLDAVIVARAGVERIGRAGEATETLDVDTVLPAPAQGALAVEAVAEGQEHCSEEALYALTVLDDELSHRRADAERAVLSTLNAGCTAPVGAYATGTTFRAGVFGLDGSRRVTWSGEGEPSVEMGRDAAEYLRAHGALDLM